MGLSTTPRASQGVLVRRRSAARPRGVHIAARVGAGGGTHITRASVSPRRTRQHRRHDRYGLNRTGGGSGLPV